MRSIEQVIAMLDDRIEMYKQNYFDAVSQTEMAHIQEVIRELKMVKDYAERCEADG